MAAREFEVVHLSRRPLWHPVGICQMLGALFFSSYFFFWLVGLLVLVALAKCGLISTAAAVALVLTYLGSIALYRPQYSKGSVPTAVWRPREMVWSCVAAMCTCMSTLCILCIL